MAVEEMMTGGTTCLTERDLHGQPAETPDSSTSSRMLPRGRVTVGSTPRGYLPVRGNNIWWKPTITALAKLLMLDENWDSYGAVPIDPTTVKAAVSLLSAVMRNDTPAPSVVPTSSGGVQLEWHTRGVDLEVEFLSPVRVRGSYEDHRTRDEWEADLTYNLQPLTEAIARLTQA